MMQIIWTLFLPIVFISQTAWGILHNGQTTCQNDILSIDQSQIVSLPPPNSANDDVIWAKYGQVFDEFYDVPAFSNKANSGGGRFQCTELASRFSSEIFGIPTNHKVGLGNGDVVARNMSARFSEFVVNNNWTLNQNASLRYFDRNCLRILPGIGSVLSMRYPRIGHVGIIRNIVPLAEGQVEIFLFEQHGVKRARVGQELPRTRLIFTRDSQGYWHNPNFVGVAQLVLLDP